MRVAAQAQARSQAVGETAAEESPSTHARGLHPLVQSAVGGLLRRRLRRLRRRHWRLAPPCSHPPPP